MRQSMRNWRCSSGLLAITLLLPASALAQLSVDRWTVCGGSTGYVEAGGFVVAGTIGQPVVDMVASSPFEVKSGFWTSGSPAVADVGDDAETPPAARPGALRIHAAAPNPVTRSTRIAFHLPDARQVDVRVFDVSGRMVRTLRAGSLPAGSHTLQWDAADDQSRRLPAGLYKVRFRLGDFQQTQNLVVLH